MKIVVLYRPEDAWSANIVTTAMRRSFSDAQVAASLYGDHDGMPQCAVLINPDEAARPLLSGLRARSAKVLILGRLVPYVADQVGLRVVGASPVDVALGEAVATPARRYDISRAAVHYTDDHPLGRCAIMSRRPLSRYDFTDEWNNLGYGRILTDDSPWALAMAVECNGATATAWVTDEHEHHLCVYAACFDTSSASVLWFNRPVGPVDSSEWGIVEAFFGEYRADDLPCLPYLVEVPAGFDGAVTMRLDCDQAIGSSRQLFHAYASAGVPFSLALDTGLVVDAEDLRLLQEVIASGGSVVSHSADHEPDWGGSYEAALQNAVRSRRWIEANVPGSGPVRHAVSPFHQNPPYAVQALADAGYRGFVGGTVHNDPEYLLGRAGRAPLVNGTIVSHSQQCMLHGDCYHRYGQSIDVYKEAFENCVRARAIFGYLDHPLSDTYQYGWTSEAERESAHMELIDYMKSFPNIWWCNLNECLDFLVSRAETLLWVDEDGQVAWGSNASSASPAVAAGWKGESFAR